MRLTKLVRFLGYTLVVVGLSGCGDQGWVRVSPDGRYTTIVRDVEVSEEGISAELALYEFDRDATTPVARFSLESKSQLPFAWVANCQWTPDSRALSFLAVESELEAAGELAPSEEADAAAISRFREARISLMLYEVASRELLRLPIDSPIAANWSRDGKHLIVYHPATQYEETDTIALYRTDTWMRVGAVAVPADYCDNLFVQEWAVLLSDAPLSALVLLGNFASEGDNSIWSLLESFASEDDSSSSSWIRGGDLYLLRGGHLTPFTTSGDVQAFWVDATSSVVRWACVQHRKYLAVFERTLSGSAPRRLVLLPHSALEADARVLFSYYRFSPQGNKLAWYSEDQCFVLDIPTGTVRTLTSGYPKEKRGDTVSALKRASPIGFDWRDNETLVIQRGGELEQINIRRLRQ